MHTDEPLSCRLCAADHRRHYALASHTRRAQVSSPDDAAAILQPLLAGLDREHCVQVALDTRHRVLAVSITSIGTVDHTFMSPRDVYRDALLAGATALFVAHNHPSGDTNPSTDDRRVTRRLAEAGEVVGVTLLDHLIIGDTTHWTSLARLGIV